jgi:hypothetical protein
MKVQFLSYAISTEEGLETVQGVTTWYDSRFTCKCTWDEFTRFPAFYAFFKDIFEAFFYQIVHYLL